MTLYDISLGLSADLPVWPGDEKITLEQVESMDRGAHANVTRLSMSAHAGTHVDAPHHFLNDHRTVDNLRLDVLTGPCLVVDLSDFDGHITAEILEKKKWSHKTPRILFKTKNSARWQAGEKEFFTAFQAVSEDGAKWLVDHGIQLVGVDYLSVAPYKQSGPTHTILLQEGIVVLEGINLSGVSGGIYELYCLPLKLVGSDGAPARAILVGP